MFRIRLLRPLALVAAGVALSATFSIATAGSPRGGPAPGPKVTAVTPQVQLTLQLPAAAYPVNALVPATVSVTNRTSRPISTWDCLVGSFGAEVVGNDGVQLYPPLLPPPGPPWSECPGVLGPAPTRHVVTIPAGSTLVRTTDIVLRGQSVRGWVDLDLDTGQGKPAVVLTPTVRVRVVAAPAPKVELQTRPTLQARVTPVNGAGPILVSEFARCPGTATTHDRVVAAAPYSRWSVAPGTVLVPFSSPRCAATAEWVLFVGQIGLPVQQVYSCRQHNLCAYAPPTATERAIAACKADIAHAVVGGRLPRSAARYAIGLTGVPPSGLTATQLSLARSFHNRCSPLLHARKP